MTFLADIPPVPTTRDDVLWYALCVAFAALAGLGAAEAHRRRKAHNRHERLLKKLCDHTDKPDHADPLARVEYQIPEE